MKHIRQFAWASMSLLLCLSCGRSKAQVQTSTASPTDTLTTLMLPSIPVMLNTPEQRAQYLVAHYWDLVNWADTNYIHHPEITEQGWVNFIDLLRLVKPEEADEALKALIRKTNVEKKSLQYIMSLAEKYLYDPNSPLRNEEYYLSTLQAALDSPLLTEIEKLRPADQKNSVLLNRVGTQANNFHYTLSTGQQAELYQVQAPYTLLFFSNPDCHACVEALDQMKSLQYIQQAIQQKQVIVLSVYPDEDVASWKSHLNDYPNNWIKAYDKKQVIREKNLYDLKAIPSLYLLDKDKKVILKDATPATVNEWLSQKP